MKALLMFMVFLTTFNCQAALRDSLPKAPKRLNVIISNRAGKIDPALLSTQIQSLWNQFFHHRHLRFMIVNTIEEAVQRVSKLMEKEHALIGNLWLDSHGHMGRRTSLVELGDIELNYESLQESWINQKVSLLGKFCDSTSTVVVGSCYSAAGYMSAGTDSFPPRRMNGDLMMAELAELFNQATIYGSVSWITTKPGFFNGGYASAGHPWAKKFKDVAFRSVWDSLGVWKSYNAQTGLRLSNTVSMNHKGEIVVQEKAFLDIPKNKRTQEKIIRKLKAGNFNPKYFYKFRNPLHVSNGRSSY